MSRKITIVEKSEIDRITIRIIGEEDEEEKLRGFGREWDGLICCIGARLIRIIKREVINDHVKLWISSVT